MTYEYMYTVEFLSKYTFSVIVLQLNCFSCNEGHNGIHSYVILRLIMDIKPLLNAMKWRAKRQ